MSLVPYAVYHGTPRARHQWVAALKPADHAPAAWIGETNHRTVSDALAEAERKLADLEKLA